MGDQVRIRYTAEYSYPGSFFPETSARDVPDASLESVRAAQPDDRWYAAEVKEIKERRFAAENGQERWLRDDDPKKVASWVIGEKIHWESIPDTDQNSILRSNIRGNSKDGYGVKTRAGNWQIASDYLDVIPA